MEIVNLPLKQLREAPWNPNQADASVLDRLSKSIEKFGLVQVLVVRSIGNSMYEVLSGNQRLGVLREKGFSSVPCVVANLDDAQARLLAQVLNRVHGQDNLGLKAEMIQDLLKALPEEEILSILPDSKLDLTGLANLGQESLANYFQNWELARSNRLRTLQFRLTDEQMILVQKALNKFINSANKLQGDNPNIRGKALYLLCKHFIEEVNHE